MKVEQRIRTKTKGWTFQDDPGLRGKAQLMLLFAERLVLKATIFFEEIKHWYPDKNASALPAVGLLFPCTSPIACTLHNQTMTVTTFSGV